ncbi:MAG: hypothetical protein ACHQHN_20105 [Sphingobacteriales bacterium]
MRKSKFHKLYFPGLISLVGLPLICIWHLLNHQPFRRQNGMRVAWESAASLKEWTKFTHQKFDFRSFRKYKDLFLTGNKLHDAGEIRNLLGLITLLEKRTDTINGIRLSLQIHTRYEEIVNVLDICYQDESENITAMPYENKILIWYNSSHQHLATDDLDKGGIMITQVENRFLVVRPDSHVGFNVELTNCFNIIRSFWLSIIVFLLMIYFTLSKTRRYLKFSSSNSNSS